MALDAIPTYPSEYDGTGTTNNPPGSDSRRQGDDQLRILKANLQQAFSNIAGTVTASHQEINRLVGVSLTDPIITLPSGAIMLFEAPAAAPTGWVKKTDAAYNDVAIRIATGALTQGGTYSFSTLFASLPKDTGGLSGVAFHAISQSEMPVHDHGGGAHVHNVGDRTGGGGPQNILDYTPSQLQTGSTNVNILSSGNIIASNGASQGHSHNFDNRLKYRDAYFAQKS